MRGERRGRVEVYSKAEWEWGNGGLRCGVCGEVGSRRWEVEWSGKGVCVEGAGVLPVLCVCGE